MKISQITKLKLSSLAGDISTMKAHTSIYTVSAFALCDCGLWVNETLAKQFVAHNQSTTSPQQNSWGAIK